MAQQARVHFLQVVPVVILVIILKIQLLILVVLIIVIIIIVILDVVVLVRVCRATLALYSLRMHSTDALSSSFLVDMEFKPAFVCPSVSRGFKAIVFCRLSASRYSNSIASTKVTL